MTKTESIMRQSSKLTIYNWLTKIMPATKLCRRIRVACLKWAGVRLGAHVEIGDGVIVRGDGRISIGRNARLYDDVYILCKRDAEIVIDDDVTVGTRAYFESGGKIIIGKRTGVWQSCLITANCGSQVVIEEDCKIAHMTSLKTTTHSIAPSEACIGWEDQYQDIHIGRGSWICAGAIILPGVSLGEKCLVAAGAVVTRNLPAFTLAAGVPAVEKKRYE